ncbi:MAG TPA: hypothetical protein VFX91_12570 [Alcanivorax sp.]|nr:hypothetical protein [Alcanivorax sp.]
MADKRVPTYDPRISVTLRKNVRREFVAGGDGLGGTVPASARYKAADRTIDLTPYLGENGGVRVTKNVRQPAGGFVISLADRMFQGSTAQMESLYGLIEPMDVIEIRMAREPARYNGLPIVMRGFVSSVRRTQVVGNGGQPQRAIQVAGQDYGKLWQIIQIRYFANYVMGQQLLSFLRFAQNYGVNSDRNFAPSEFMAEVTREIINEFTAIMRRSGSADGPEDTTSPVRDIDIFDLTVPGSDAKISPYGANTWNGGALYQMMTYYGDVGPWNELFIEDREAGPALVYRPNPFKTPAGEFIREQGAAYAPSGGTVDAQGVRTISLTDADLQVDNTGRSDANLANYYVVDNPQFNLIDGGILKMMAAEQRADTFFIEDYRNCAPWLYGIRIMQQQTQQGLRVDGKAENDVVSGRGAMIDWLDRRREVIVQNNRDNVVFEEGSMTLKGNEQMRAGSYLQMQRGTMTTEYYVPSIEHSFMPFRSFTTTVQVERGTGFIARAQRGRGRQSPYLAETSGGGVYDE